MTKEQLGQLILSSERQLYVTAKSILTNDQDCEDAIQEAIVKAFSKIYSLKNDNYAKTWLMRILINECYSIGRRMRKIEVRADVNTESIVQEETHDYMVIPAAEGVKLKNEIAEDKITISNIGNTIPIGTMYKYVTGRPDIAGSISVCVEDVQIFDDLSILDSNSIPEDWKNAVSDDGKLKQNNLSYVKAGDGDTSLDKVVNEGSVNQKLVYANVIYTSNSDSELKNIQYICDLVTMKHENGYYRIYTPSEEPGNGYDYYIGDGVARTGEMTYYSADEEYRNGANYISSLQPGESIQIAMVWIVNEEDLENMYLSFNSDGDAYEFSDSILKAGLVYIGK